MVNYREILRCEEITLSVKSLSVSNAPAIPSVKSID